MIRFRPSDQQSVTFAHPSVVGSVAMRAESRLIRIVAAVVATVAEDIEVDATAGGAAKLRQWTRATDGQQVSPFDQQQQEQGAQPPVPTGIHPSDPPARGRGGRGDVRSGQRNTTPFIRWLKSMDRGRGRWRTLASGQEPAAAVCTERFLFDHATR